jgi:hypothetical protein
MEILESLDLSHLAGYRPRDKVITAKTINPISNRWRKDTLYTCDGSSAIQYFPYFFKQEMVV